MWAIVLIHEYIVLHCIINNTGSVKSKGNKFIKKGLKGLKILQKSISFKAVEILRI